MCVFTACGLHGRRYSIYESVLFAYGAAIHHLRFVFFLALAYTRTRTAPECVCVCVYKIPSTQRVRCVKVLRAYVCVCVGLRRRAAVNGKFARATNGFWVTLKLRYDTTGRVFVYALGLSACVCVCARVCMFVFNVCTLRAYMAQVCGGRMPSHAVEFMCAHTHVVGWLDGMNELHCTIVYIHADAFAACVCV